ncbi:Coiled-coil domain-containing protein, partial [Ophiophagus hannah]
MSAAVAEGEAGTDVDVEAEASGGASRDIGSGAVPRPKLANLNSDDPLERIAARRVRIAARLEAKRREALGEDPDAKKFVEEEQSKSHKQIEDSRQRLAKLLLDGTQLVSNIQVAADSREAHRRSEEEELTRQRVEKLENEAKANLDKFDEITAKWAKAKQKTIPQDLWEALNLQQQHCALLIEEKNKVISELQQELKSKDDQYVKDLRKQNEDINLLLERMEEQIRNLVKNYRRELLHIELDFMMARLKKVEEYEQELNQLRVQDAEEYNVIKIKLEHDVQRLKLAKQIKQYREENMTLTADYKRIVEQYKDLQRTMRHFAIVDAEHFLDVWLMNEEEAKALIRKAFDADRVIHTQQLGLPWTEPDDWFLHNVGPIMHTKKLKSANELAREVITPDRKFSVMLLPQVLLFSLASQSLQQLISSSEGRSSEENEAVQEEEYKEGVEPEPESKKLWSISRKTIKHVLELLCDESGFLIESKLRGLLQPLERPDCILMKLDSIFTALSIDSEDDVCRMVEFFMNFKAQKMAGSQDLEAVVADTVVKEVSGDAEILGEEEEVSAEPREEDKSSTVTTVPLSAIYMHPDDILKALKAFVQEFQTPRDQWPQIKKAHEERDNSKDSEYWDALAHVIPDGKLKLWDALIVALQKYYHFLTLRAKLIEETDGLTQQNEELQILLQQYLQSPVSKWVET